MRDYRRFGAGWIAAWRMLTDFPLPAAAERYEDSKVPAARMLGAFPLLGALCGALIALAGWFVAVLSNRFAGAAVFAVLSLVFLIFKDSGRGWLLFVSWLLNLIDGETFTTALAKASSERSVLDRKLAGGVAAALALWALVMLFLIGLYGAKGFMIPLVAGAFSTQGEAIPELSPEAGGVADPERRGRWIMWAICGAVVIAAFPFFPLATAFGILALCLINMALRNFLLRELADFDADTVTWLGFVAEAALLVCAFLWTLK